MNKIFSSATLRMPKLLNELLQKSPVSRENLGIVDIPQSGAYIFFEDGNAIYVGRSNRMKERLKEHSSISSDHYSASLAFRIAKQEYIAIKPKGKKTTNQQLMKNQDFNKMFQVAKERISKTQIKYILIENQIEQALFEIYAHLELNTKYNDFATH